MHFNVEPGPSDRIRFPQGGPFDERRGYVDMPAFTASLQGKGYQVESQARFSPGHAGGGDKGIFPAYQEKTQAGLNLLDKRGQSMFAVNYPLKVYSAFDSIPEQVVQTLLFIENRSLLDSAASQPQSRRGMVAHGQGGRRSSRKQKLGKEGNVAGGSTLATQLEKYKHSRRRAHHRPHGKVPADDFRQPARLPGRGEHDRGPQAHPAGLRELGAAGGAARIRGGQRAVGRPAGLVRDLPGLHQPPAEAPAQPRARGRTASIPAWTWRRWGRDTARCSTCSSPTAGPRSYLLLHRDALESISENYLQILGREGVISPQLRDAALRSNPELMRRAAAFFPAAFVERKHVNAVRNRLCSPCSACRASTIWTAWT